MLLPIEEKMKSGNLSRKKHLLLCSLKQMDSKKEHDPLSLNKLLAQVLSVESLMVAKSEISPSQISSLKEFVNGEDEQFWHIACTHRLYAQASEETIEQTEILLQKTLPSDLKSLLRLTNGGELFIAPNLWFPEENYARYRLFGTTEIRKVNQDLFDRFRGMLGKDPDFQNIYTLNYIAFCDAHDDNYLAALLDNPMYGSIFFLDHEYLYRPYSVQDSDLYYPVSNSLENWIEQLVSFSGWNGFRNEDLIRP